MIPSHSYALRAIVVLGMTGVLAACGADRIAGLHLAPSDGNLSAQANTLNAQRLRAYAEQAQGCVFELRDNSSSSPRRLTLPSSLLPFHLPAAKPFRLSGRVRAVAKNTALRVKLASGELLTIRCVTSRAPSDGKLPAITEEELSSARWIRTLSWLRAAPRTTVQAKPRSAESDLLRRSTSQTMKHSICSIPLIAMASHVQRDLT